MVVNFNDEHVLQLGGIYKRNRMNMKLTFDVNASVTGLPRDKKLIVAPTNKSHDHDINYVPVFGYYRIEYSKRTII